MIAKKEKKNLRLVVVCPHHPAPEMSYVYVRYGDNQRDVFNANCETRILLDYLRRKTEFVEHDQVDLADASTLGVVRLNMPERLEALAAQFLESGKEYILAKCDISPADGVTRSNFVALYRDDSGQVPVLVDAPVAAAAKGAKKK